MHFIFVGKATARSKFLYKKFTLSPFPVYYNMKFFESVKAKGSRTRNNLFYVLYIQRKVELLFNEVDHASSFNDPFACVFLFIFCQTYIYIYILAVQG